MLDDRILKVDRLLADLIAKDLCYYGDLHESNRKINNASRKLINTYTEVYGTAWVGKINLYREDRNLNRPVMWQVKNAESVLTFSCEFVLPNYDEELERLIRARDAAHQEKYQGTAWDIALLGPIKDRLYSIDGLDLVWT